MSSHNAPFQLFRGPLEILDEGDATTILADRTPAIVNLTSAAAETRTLARPTRSGGEITIAMKTDGGDITLTVTGGYNEDGDTTFVFSDPGQFATFVAVESATDVFSWRLVSSHLTGNAVNAIEGVTAGLKVAKGSAAALDGGNPTPIATGLSTIVFAAVQLRGTAAPGDNTSVLTTDYTGSDGTLNVYAWKNTGGTDPTLVASTGTETFDWIAVGT